MKGLYSQGMEIPQCSLIVASGENLAPLARFASGRPIRDGDLVFMDLGGCFNGMFAEYTRTVVCGRANDQQRRIAAAVFETMANILTVMKPGNTNSEIYNAATETYRKHGLEDHALKTVLGHSIGLAGWEPPTIADPSITGEEFELKPNMVFSIEPTIIVPNVRGGGGVRLEDEILITEHGCEVLTRRTSLDRQLFPADALPS